MIKTYYLARFIRRLHLSSFNKCNIDRTSKVASGSALTKVRMGRYSYVGSYTLITDAEIGSFCSIGGNCNIGGGLHPTNMVSTSPVFYKGRNILRKNFANIEFEPSEKVNIGNDVWIGEGAYIKAGVSIGDGAVVGAHSVVTHDVEPYSIVAGVPAKEIRKRFDDDIVSKLLEIKWWDLSEDELKDLGNAFSDPETLINKIERKG